MRARLLPVAGAVALAAVLAVPGVALANRNTVTADCQTGLTFDMPAGEAGTTVQLWIDNVGPMFDPPLTVANQNDPVRFAWPNPDRNRVHTFTIVVDSPANTDQRIIRTIDACPTTTTTTTTTTTVASTTVPTPSTTVPPTGSTTVITTPRPTTTTVSTTVPAPPPVVDLPATGDDHTAALAGAAVLIGVGVGAVLAARRRAGVS